MNQVVDVNMMHGKVDEDLDGGEFEEDLVDPLAISVTEEAIDSLDQEEKDPRFVDHPSIGALSQSDEENSLKCLLCDFIGRNRTYLTRHYSSYHQDEAEILPQMGFNMKLLSCEWCPYTSSLQYRISRHVRLVHPEKLLKCPDCGQVFVSAHLLKKHMDLCKRPVSPDDLKEEPQSIILLENCIEETYKEIQELPIDAENVVDPLEQEVSSPNGDKKEKDTQEQNSLTPPDTVFKHSCQHCAFFTDSKTIFVRHVSKEHRLMECEQCLNTFAYQEELDEHISRIHTGGKYDCPKCTFNYKKFDQLSSHIKRNHEASITCVECDQTFALRKDLQTHVKQVHTKSKNYVCKVCSYKGNNVKKFTLHMSENHPEEMLKCAKCDRRFALEMHLEKHLHSYHSSIRYSCPSCSYVGKRLENLSAHIKSKHPKGLLACDQCDQVFALKDQLMEHMRTSHKEATKNSDDIDLLEDNTGSLSGLDEQNLPEDSVKCDACDLVFAKKKQMLKHFNLVHSKSSNEVMEYSCDKCYFITHHAESLQEHKKKHRAFRSESSRTVNCNLCKHKTNTLKKLYEHIFQFHSDKKFACSICDKKFATKENLDKHQCQPKPEDKGSSQDDNEAEKQKEVDSKKSDEDQQSPTLALRKEFQCYFCEYQSVSRVKLESHYSENHRDKSKELEAMGFDIFSLKCKLCDRYETTSWDLLRRHIKRLHTGSKFSCKFCSYSSNRMKTLRNHMFGVHRNKKEELENMGFSMPNNECPCCNFSTYNVRNYQRHIIRRHPECCFSCDICGKRLSSRIHLSRHKFAIHKVRDNTMLDHEEEEEDEDEIPRKKIKV